MNGIHKNWMNQLVKEKDRFAERKREQNFVVRVIQWKIFKQFASIIKIHNNQNIIKKKKTHSSRFTPIDRHIPGRTTDTIIVKRKSGHICFRKPRGEAGIKYLILRSSLRVTQIMEYEEVDSLPMNTRSFEI